MLLIADIWKLLFKFIRGEGTVVVKALENLKILKHNLRAVCVPTSIQLSADFILMHQIGRIFLKTTNFSFLKRNLIEY